VIHVERPRQPPKALLVEGRRAAKEADRFFTGRTTVSKRQVKFVDFQFPDVWQVARPQIEALFQGKCPFCESRFGTVGELEIAHFRPTRDALGLDGTTSPEHYYWLAYEWQNLYLICRVCNRNKRNLFPVAESRAGLGTPWAKLEQQERRLLLDPCLDLPEEHLVFGDAGHVASVTPDANRSGAGNPAFGDDDRGTITIDTFGLNRDNLIQERKRVVSDVTKALDRALKEAGGDRLKREQAIGELVDSSLPYAMVRRQVVSRRLEALDDIDSLQTSQLASTEATQAVQASKPRRKSAFERLQRHEAQQAGASITDTASYARTTRIASVRIENFRGIDELEFEIPTTGWKMLLGENGTGKSSILQAVAIALMGQEHAKRLRRHFDLEPGKLVRRGTTSSRIVVHQAAAMEPIEVRVTARGFEYPPARAQQKTVLLGFGSARWLPRPKSLPPETGDWIRVRNLLNPFVPLCNANEWLRALDPRTNRFKAAEAVIKAILRLPATTRFRLTEGEVRVQFEGEPLDRTLSLDQLSDGYQSALAMAAGIMGPLFSKWDVMREAEGVVLVDELDAHLHPRWKMRIVGDLRRAFPNVQFLASTHEPLCLRGLLEREILSLRKVEGELEYTDDLPSPQDLRVDQLLTSRFFGLHSTLDPDSERDLESYYNLLALDARTPAQSEELEQLRGRVGGQGLLGDTVRDQVIYAVIDKYIAKELREADPSTSAQRRAETEERVAEIWRDAITSDADLEIALAEILSGEPT
jgi:predicted ATPase